MFKMNNAREELQKHDWRVETIAPERLEKMGYVDGLTAYSQQNQSEITALVSHHDLFFSYDDYAPIEKDTGSLEESIEAVAYLIGSILNHTYKTYVYIDRRDQKTGQELLIDQDNKLVVGRKKFGGRKVPL